MKTDTRTLSPSAQESLRIRAVKAVLAGHTQVEVAGIFGVPRQTVGLWVKAHRRGGLRSLKAKKRGRPKGGTLLPWQAAQIVRAITDRTPDQLKLPFYLWTREAVGRLIEDRFGIPLSGWTGGRGLAPRGVIPAKAGGSRDLLGRRDGGAFRPCGGTVLRAPGADAGHPGDGATVRLQHDLRHHQPGAASRFTGPHASRDG